MTPDRRQKLYRVNEKEIEAEVSKLLGRQDSTSAAVAEAESAGDMQTVGLLRQHGVILQGRQTALNGKTARLLEIKEAQAKKAEIDHVKVADAEAKRGLESHQKAVDIRLSIDRERWRKAEAAVAAE